MIENIPEKGMPVRHYGQKEPFGEIIGETHDGGRWYVRRYPTKDNPRANYYTVPKWTVTTKPEEGGII